MEGLLIMTLPHFTNISYYKNRYEISAAEFLKRKMIRNQEKRKKKLNRIMKKLKIEIPTNGLSKSQMIEHLKEINNEYDNYYNIIESRDNDYHYEKYDDDRKAFIIFFNVKNMSRQKAEQNIWEKMELLKKYDDRKAFIYLISYNDDDDHVVSLSKNEDLSEIEKILNSEEFKKIN